MAIALEQAIHDKTAIVGVIGLGYVGLPLIRAFVGAGFRTMGFDVDHGKVEGIDRRTRQADDRDTGAIFDRDHV